jgi:hypothetical protein
MFGAPTPELLACVSTIHPDEFQAGHQWDESRQQLPRSTVVANVHRRHPLGEEQPGSVREQVPFTAQDAFGRIVALVGARFLGDADTLAAHDRRRSLRIPALLLPGGPAQSYEDALPEAFQTPSPKPVIHGSPRRKVVGQEPPGVATSDDVEDGVENLLDGMFTWSVTRLGGR